MVASEPGGEEVSPPPLRLPRERSDSQGDAFPDSLVEGRETDVGPSLFVDLRLDDCREDCEPPDERERDLGGRIAGGGSGGGALGTIGS